MVINKYLAEFLGTFVLVFFGSMGILSVGGAVGAAEIVAISFAFGLALLAGIWAVAHVSGAHFNPAVTLAMLVDGRTSFGDAVGYWVAQFAGATVASLVVLAATSREAVAGTVTGYETLSTGILMEIVLTLVFVWVILAVTRTGGNHAPVAIALTLVSVHLAGIPFSGASVNPARSFGPAVVSGEFDQLWVYIVFPLVGGIIAWGLYRLFPAASPAAVDTVEVVEVIEVTET
jgi:aquaporin Z